MTRSPNLRLRTLAAGLAILAVSACGDTTPVEAVTPDVDSACALSQQQLDALRGSEPDAAVNSDAAQALFGILQAMPDVTTEVGRPRSLLGDEVQALRNRLSWVQTAARRADPRFDAVDVEADMRAAFARLNEAASQFEVTSCLSDEVLESVLVPQVSRVAIATAEVAPTGDYGADVEAVCERFRAREAELLAAHATDPFANALLVGRLRSLGTDLLIDAERLEPPTDRQHDVDLLIETLAEFDQALASAQAAQLRSQEALDDAIERFDLVNEQLVVRLEALDPGC